MHPRWTIPRRRALEHARASNARSAALRKPDAELPDPLAARPRRFRSAQDEADHAEALRRYQLRKARAQQ